MERLPRLLSGKESSCQCRRCRKCGFNPWERKIPQKRKWQPTLVFLHGKSHRHWSLVGYSCVCIYSTTFQLCIRLNSSLCKPLSHVKFLLYTIACCCLVAKSYLTLCNSMDCVACWAPLSVVFQAGILEWIAISSFRGSSQPRHQTHFCYVFCISSNNKEKQKVLSLWENKSTV